MTIRFREPLNGFTHAFAACLAAMGTIVLMLSGKHTAYSMAFLTVYGISQVLMFSSSALYHLKNASPEGLKWLRKLDHSAIYLSIAGTYTPICLYFFSGFWQWGMLSIIWVCAIAGIVFKLLFAAAPRWISTVIYLVMGWFSLAAIAQILDTFPAAGMMWLLAGGLFYSAGAVIYALKKPNFFGGILGFHEIWHVFVILGSFSHYMLIAVFIAPYW